LPTLLVLLTAALILLVDAAMRDPDNALRRWLREVAAYNDAQRMQQACREIRSTRFSDMTPNKLDALDTCRRLGL
jgi:hypothetical protein